MRQLFADALDLPADTDVESLEIGQHPHWDSVGHMTLVAELEARFGISLEADDIIDMTNYTRTLDILRRHGIEV